MVVDFWTGELTGVAKWNPKTWGYDIQELRGPLSAAVLEAVSETLADTLVGAVWHFMPFARGGTSSDGFAALAAVIDAKREPSTVVFKLVNYGTLAAAAHFGLGPLAPLAGQVAEKMCRKLFPPDDHSLTREMLGAVQFAVCAGEGKPLASQEVRARVTKEVAAKIGVLLGSGPADGKARGGAGTRTYRHQAARVTPADGTIRESIRNQPSPQRQPSADSSWPRNAQAAGHPAYPLMRHYQRPAPGRDAGEPLVRRAQAAMTARQMWQRIIEALDGSGVMPDDYLWMIAMIAITDSEPEALMAGRADRRWRTW